MRRTLAEGAPFRDRTCAEGRSRVARSERSADRDMPSKALLLPADLLVLFLLRLDAVVLTDLVRSCSSTATASVMPVRNCLTEARRR